MHLIISVICFLRERDVFPPKINKYWQIGSYNMVILLKISDRWRKDKMLDFCFVVYFIFYETNIR